MGYIISTVEEEHDIAPFFDDVKNFYIATLNKFSFGDTLLQDLGVLVPDKVSAYSVEAITRLAKCFPQHGLSDPTSLGDGCFAAAPIANSSEKQTKRSDWHGPSSTSAILSRMSSGLINVWSRWRDLPAGSAVNLLVQNQGKIHTYTCTS